MKSVSIELWRFVFAVYMVVYHSASHIYGYQTGGYIGVDLFFILSGYFLAVSKETACLPWQARTPQLFRRRVEELQSNIYLTVIPGYGRCT